MNVVGVMAVSGPDKSAVADEHPGSVSSGSDEEKESAQPVAPSPDDDITVDRLEAAFNNRGDFLLIFLSPVFFTLFFCVFASAALTHVPIKEIFPSHRGLAMTLMAIGDETFEDTTLQFKRIHTPDDALQWLTQSLVPTLFTAPDANALAAIPAARRARVATYQKIVGAVEIRVFSVPSIACSSSNELTKIYHPCHNFNAVPFEVPWYIPANSPRDDVLVWLSGLQANGSLISPSMTSLHVTIPMYNGELDLLCIVSLRINFQSGGFVDTKYKLTSIPLDPYGGQQSSVDVLVVIFFAMTLVMEYRKYRQVLKCRQRRFWTPWRVVTWFVLIAVVVFYACWVVLCVLVYDLSLQNKVITLDDPALDIDANVKLFETYVGDILANVTTMDYVMIALRLVAMSGCCLLMLRILGSLRFHPRLNVVTATLVKSLQDLLPFCFVFVVCLSAFVVSGCLLFGDNVKQFSTASMAYVTVVNMLFGQFDLAQIFDVNYYFAVVWYWSAMVVLFLVLFNLLLAVVLEVFYREHHKADAQAAPYIQAISDLQRMEGVWLWPWAHRDMLALGRAVKAKHLAEITAPAIAKALNLSNDHAKTVLAKATAFAKVMDVLRQAYTAESPRKRESHVECVHQQLGEMETRIASMVARLDTHV
ncbi:hypothetical protein H310_09334 [Aphanomyces invadans]|uniref:Polycystin cation channel PKD1/PKD2 domain-containing protein n=1 Tax=Aphanomyces invadans TaxID=157072 RepID=A0A024TVN2_9STRA|nr:hypothetical protein H310_09334 [Aphanomyces invadans]ETV98039.1 hypothetical protein H310_09334 [Aphanomyces invadans]|eukprot:XP_008873600.1 hypothetical protein H310_09334 [Aphanomyces invadans]